MRAGERRDRASSHVLTTGIDPEGLRARALVLATIRSWFHRRGFLEVPTPALVPTPAVEEHLHPIRAGAGWLRTSPELALKRVIASGLPRVYEIGPVWRDREDGPWHQQEFLMLEWYRVGAALSDIMNDVEDLIATCAGALGTQPPESWQRTTVRDLMRTHAGVDPATATASEMSAEDAGWDDAFFRRWVNDVEPNLADAMFIAGYPATQAALARVRTDGPWPVACRFEAYIDGVELANAYLELTDTDEQRRRTMQSNLERQAQGESPHPTDHAFMEAVGRMPTTAGIALGVDRLVAVLCGWDRIHRGTVGR